MTESPALRPSTSRQLMMLVAFGVMQVAAFFCVLVWVTLGPIGPDPWIQILGIGTVLAQCGLLAAASVMGPGRLFIRMMCSAAIVIFGILVIDAADTLPHGSVERTENLLVIEVFSLSLWGVIQIPFWLVRLLRGAHTVSNDLTACGPSNPRQYGIRQLMALTLAVASILGVGRWLLPLWTNRELRDIGAATWKLLVTFAIAHALVAATTTITTLHPTYWRAGMAVSALVTGLVAYAAYSVCILLGQVPPNEWMPFAVMIPWTYVWLQLSVLLVRAAGYRIVV